MAVVDAGSSSFILTVLLDTGEFFERVEPLRVASRTVNGRIPNETAKSIRETLRSFASEASRFGVRRLHVLGTGIFREAENGEEILKGSLVSADHVVKILSAREEAMLSFMAAIRDFGSELAVFDVGGVSVECVVSSNSGEEMWSKRLGAAVVRDRFGLVPPVKSSLLERTIAELKSELQPDVPVSNVVVLGSSGVLAAAFSKGIGTFDRGLHGEEISREEIDAMLEDVSKMDPDRVEACGTLFEGRGDLFLAGLVILRSIVEATGVSELIVSTKGFRHEVAWMLMEGKSLDDLRL